MQNETLEQKLTGILEGMVGEDKPNSSAELLGFTAYLRELIPETVDGILEAVREQVDKKLVIDVNPSRDDQRDWYRGLGKEEAQREMRDNIISIFLLAGGGADGEGNDTDERGIIS